MPWKELNWSEIEGYPDRTLFQSPAWLGFVTRTQGAEPQVLALTRGVETVGYFTGLFVRRWGLRIAGSPFKGWTTSYMGFNTRDERVRDEALRGIGPFILRNSKCAHLELMDRQVDGARAARLALDYRPFRTFEIDLSQTETELVSRMHDSVRRYIRRAEKQRNIVIEECSDPGFADDYYAQLREVFGKDGLAPTYGIDRVRALMDCLLPTGDLLLLRARNRSGRCIATGIFPARYGMMYFWGGASYLADLSEHPNEVLQWHAMRHWKRRGMTCYDMGGGGKYKEKYGGVVKERAWIRQSRSRWVSILRDLGYQVFSAAQRIKGWRGSTHRVRKLERPVPKGRE